LILSATQTERLRGIVAELLAQKGDGAPFADGDSLFLSGRLDSMAATQLIMAIESEFGIEIGGADFDVSILDSIEEMTALVK
jgi:acyl carrier protein